MTETRLYSLFEKQNNVWVRISEMAFRKSQAIQVFQNALLAGWFGGTDVKGIRELKIVKS